MIGPYCALFLAAFFTGPLHIHGSGSLYDPPNRAVMWKYGFPTQKNYNYMQLNCGGVKQPENGTFNCGICGDAPGDKKYHERGGKFGSGTISRYYPAGIKEIPIKVELLAFEKGFFEFRICPADKKKVTQECLDENLLPIKEGYLSGTPMRFYPKAAGDHRLTIAINPKLKCDRCVIQWRYHTANSWGTDPVTNKEGLGLGPQDEFRNCADIRIGGEVPASVKNNPFFGPSIKHRVSTTANTPSTRRESMMTASLNVQPEHADHLSPKFRTMLFKGSSDASGQSTAWIKQALSEGQGASGTHGLTAQPIVNRISITSDSSNSFQSGGDASAGLAALKESLHPADGRIKLTAGTDIIKVGTGEGEMRKIKSGSKVSTSSMASRDGQMDGGFALNNQLGDEGFANGNKFGSFGIHFDLDGTTTDSRGLTGAMHTIAADVVGSSSGGQNLELSLSGFDLSRNSGGVGGAIGFVPPPPNPEPKDKVAITASTVADPTTGQFGALKAATRSAFSVDGSSAHGTKDSAGFNFIADSATEQRSGSIVSTGGTFTDAIGMDNNPSGPSTLNVNTGSTGNLGNNIVYDSVTTQMNAMHDPSLDNTGNDRQRIFHIKVSNPMTISEGMQPSVDISAGSGVPMVSDIASTTTVSDHSTATADQYKVALTVEGGNNAQAQSSGLDGFAGVGGDADRQASGGFGTFASGGGDAKTLASAVFDGFASGGGDANSQSSFNLGEFTVVGGDAKSRASGGLGEFTTGGGDANSQASFGLGEFTVVGGDANTQASAVFDGFASGGGDANSKASGGLSELTVVGGDANTQASAVYDGFASGGEDANSQASFSLGEFAVVSGDKKSQASVGLSGFAAGGGDANSKANAGLKGSSGIRGDANSQASVSFGGAANSLGSVGLTGSDANIDVNNEIDLLRADLIQSSLRRGGSVSGAVEQGNVESETYKGGVSTMNRDTTTSPTQYITTPSTFDGINDVFIERNIDAIVNQANEIMKSAGATGAIGLDNTAPAAATDTSIDINHEMQHVIMKSLDDALLNVKKETKAIKSSVDSAKKDAAVKTTNEAKTGQDTLGPSVKLEVQPSGWFIESMVSASDKGVDIADTGKVGTTSQTKTKPVKASSRTSGSRLAGSTIDLSLADINRVSEHIVMGTKAPVITNTAGKINRFKQSGIVRASTGGGAVSINQQTRRLEQRERDPIRQIADRRRTDRRQTSRSQSDSINIEGQLSSFNLGNIRESHVMGGGDSRRRSNEFTFNGDARSSSGRREMDRNTVRSDRARVDRGDRGDSSRQDLRVFDARRTAFRGDMMSGDMPMTDRQGESFRIMRDPRTGIERRVLDRDSPDTRIREPTMPFGRRSGDMLISDIRDGGFRRSSAAGDRRASGAVRGDRERLEIRSFDRMSSSRSRDRLPADRRSRDGASGDRRDSRDPKYFVDMTGGGPRVNNTAIVFDSRFASRSMHGGRGHAGMHRDAEFDRERDGRREGSRVVSGGSRTDQGSSGDTRRVIERDLSRTGGGRSSGREARRDSRSGGERRGTDAGRRSDSRDTRRATGTRRDARMTGGGMRMIPPPMGAMPFGGFPGTGMPGGGPFGGPGPIMVPPGGMPGGMPPGGMPGGMPPGGMPPGGMLPGGMPPGPMMGGVPGPFGAGLGSPPGPFPPMGFGPPGMV